MKNIHIDNPNMNRADALIQYFNGKLAPNYQNSVLNYKGCEIFSDFSQKVPATGEEKELFESIAYYFKFVLDYAHNIFVNNQMAFERKEPPYDTHIQSFVDVQSGLAKFYFYFDGAIFGLLVGASHVNIGNLIRASFPIFSKLNLEVEIKVFSTNPKERQAEVY